MHTRRKARFETVTVGWGNSIFIEDDESRLQFRVMEINSLSCRNGLRTKRGRSRQVPHGFENRGILEMVLVIHQKLLPNAQTTDTMVWNDYIQSGEPATTIILLLTLYTHLAPLHTVGTSRG